MSSLFASVGLLSQPGYGLEREELLRVLPGCKDLQPGALCSRELLVEEGLRWLASDPLHMVISLSSSPEYFLGYANRIGSEVCAAPLDDPRDIWNARPGQAHWTNWLNLPSILKPRQGAELIGQWLLSTL